MVTIYRRWVTILRYWGLICLTTFVVLGCLPATATIKPTHPSLVVSSSIGQPDETDRVSRWPRIEHQTRAIWSWAGTRATSTEELDELIAIVDKANLNVILLLIYYRGTAYFEPSIGRFPDVNQRLINQSLLKSEQHSDALSYLLAVRDQRRTDANPRNDFEVHAWFTITMNGAWDDNGPRPRADRTEPYMLHHLFPEFKLKYRCFYDDKNLACVNHLFSVIHQPFFQYYMTNLIAGLAEDYNVDGIHLDYIRAVQICYNDEALDYMGTEFDYPGCQIDYATWAKHEFGETRSLFDDTNQAGEIRRTASGRVALWQAQAVGRLVEKIQEAVRAVRANLILTAAVGTTMPSSKAVSAQGQWAWDWLDEGWVDAVFVMSYNSDTKVVIERTAEFRQAVTSERGQVRVFPGLATHEVSNHEEVWDTVIEEQVSVMMLGHIAGTTYSPPALGVALFVDRYLTDEAIELLVAGPFKNPAVPMWRP